MLNLLEKSVRVALAGYLHDAGKLLLRASGAPKELGAGASEDHSGASVKVAQKVFATLSSRLDGDVNEFGRDALLTAIGDHHAPRNLLGSIVSTADRLSHGIGYKQWLAAESNFRDSGGEPECVMRLAPVFSSAGSNRPSMYMPLKPLSPNGIFPVASALPSVATARVEYQNLWNAFDSGISKKLPGLGGDLELWFEAFDSLWMSCTHGVPAAPAHGARGNVSLYEHSRVTAAFATALWRWHVDTGETCELALARLNSSNAVEDAKEKFLLVHGDFAGIQKFIFGGEGSSNKHGADVFRGKSFFVSLVCEIAVLNLLRQLQLPFTSVLMSAAGKFLVLAPNTDSTRDVLARTQEEFDAWFKRETLGMSSLTLAATPVSTHEIVSGDESFREVIRKNFEETSRKKSQKFGLLAPNSGGALELEFGELGVCVVDGRLPATGKSEDGLSLSDLGFDFWELGRWIRREASEGLVVVESAELPLQNAQDVLRTRFFGRYRVRLEDVKTLPQNSFDGIVRVWDCGAHHFSKNAGEQSIWGGYALKPLSTYTPVVPGKDRIKSFDEIAEVGLGKEHRGFAALGIIKGDVDNLGKMFSDAAAGANFAKMAALSRILNNYFAVYLPWLLGTEYRDTYTLFAGGDDFFLLAPWCHAQKLALSIRNNFLRYAGQNPEKPEVHLSVGVVTTKAGAPVSSMADAAENALEDAKHFRRSNNGRSKDAITVFDETFAWEDLSRVGKIENAILTIERNLFAVSKKRDQQLPTVWFYQLLEFLGLARAHEATKDPRLAVWKARMAYQTARFVEREGVERDKIPVLTSEIYNKQLEMIGNQGERAFLKVALYNTIYARRSVDDGASR